MLYNKYRPATFDGVIGQPSAIVLQNMVSQRKYAHSILLTGVRGVGKTTLARIFARASNCKGKDPKPCGYCSSCKRTNHPDIHEIDSTRYGSGAAVQRLAHTMMLSPEFKRRVFIFDEAHTLTSKAMDALLKIVEEPRITTLVLLLTTEPDKIDAALRSRCMWLQLRNISKTDITKLVAKVSISEGIRISREAVGRIADYADGSARDALSLLESVSTYVDGSVDTEALDNVVGRRVDTRALADAMQGSDFAGAIREVNRLCLLYDARAVIDNLIHELMTQMNRAIEHNQSPKGQLAWIEAMREAKKDSFGYIPQLPIEMAIARMSVTVPEGGRLERLMDWDAVVRYTERSSPKLAKFLEGFKPIRIKANKVLVLKGKSVVPRPMVRKIVDAVSQFCSANIEVKII